MKDKSITFSDILMAFIVVAIFGYFYLIIYYPPSVGNNNVGEIKTALISTLAAIVGYQWGSSRGSVKKDETISDALTNKSDTLPGTTISKEATTTTTTKTPEQTITPSP